MKKAVMILSGIVGTILIALGVISKFNGNISSSVSIIGGADGPTSIFLAGKLGNGFSTGCTIAGIIFLVVFIVFVMKKKS